MANAFFESSETQSLPSKIIDQMRYCYDSRGVSVSVLISTRIIIKWILESEELTKNVHIGLSEDIIIKWILESEELTKNVHIGLSEDTIMLSWMKFRTHAEIHPSGKYVEFIYLNQDNEEETHMIEMTEVDSIKERLKKITIVK
jgi:hypothetical protein